MKKLNEYILESTDYSKREKQCEKIANWLSINTFPELDKRIKIKLDDGWYCVLSHIKFKNSHNPLIYISFIKNDKEYIYYSGKYYGKSNVEWGKDTKYEEVLEKYLFDIKNHNNWYDAYVYNSDKYMKNIKYQDKDFASVEEINIYDIK